MNPPAGSSRAAICAMLSGMPWTCRVAASLLALAALALFSASCKRPPQWEKGRKFLHYPLRAKVGSLDPATKSSTYDTMARAQAYESLFTYEYLVDPFTLKPLLAAAMPQVSEDKLTYTIEVKEGVYFHDDPCFQASAGDGRELVAQDFVYSLMRMADRDLSPGAWWLYRDRIAGFDEFQARMNERQPGQPFDWDADIAGLKATDRYTLQIKLKRPYPQLLYILAMTYSAAVPRECAEYYGKTKDFGSNPVGTGPFRLVEWVRGSRLIFERNPEYREAYYPTEASPKWKERGLLAAAGQRIPFLDGVAFYIFEQPQPRWLKFRVGDLDIIKVPSEYQPMAFDENLDIRGAFRDDGIESYKLPLLDLVYTGFNMDDPIVGVGEKAKYLRQAISLAVDTGEVNKSFYNSACTLYDGPIPSGLSGYEAGVLSPYRGPNIEKARELMAKAGYPDGKGLPPLQFEGPRSDNSPEQAEMLARQLSEIGIVLEANFNSFPELQDKLKRKKAQIFRLAWNADYPDAENFLQLYYGPNESPGSNNFNYKNPAYDALYDRAKSMPPSPERTQLYIQMRDILIEDVPSIGSMSRIRFYMWNKRLVNVRPIEVWPHWIKFLDINDEARD